MDVLSRERIGFMALKTELVPCRFQQGLFIGSMRVMTGGAALCQRRMDMLFFKLLPLFVMAAVTQLRFLFYQDHCPDDAMHLMTEKTLFIGYRKVLKLLAVFLYLVYMATRN